MEDDEEGWTCQRCTLRNPRDATRCQSGCEDVGVSDEEEVGDEGFASDDADHDMAIDGPAEADHVVRIHQNKRKWQEREERRVKSKTEHVKSQEEAAAQRAQIFSSVECFRILSEELFRIQDARSPALGAEAIDDDVHRWSIELRGFEPSSDLVHDLQECKRRWGFDHIELRLVFKEDLYPFYPPRLSVVRPRLLGCTAPALEGHPALHLERWDPFVKVADLLARLRRFLQANARVDVDCEANAAPGGAYCDPLPRLASSLAQLGGVAGIIAPGHSLLYENSPDPLPPLRSAFSGMRRSEHEVPRADALRRRLAEVAAAEAAEVAAAASGAAAAAFALEGEGSGAGAEKKAETEGAAVGGGAERGGFGFPVASESGAAAAGAVPKRFWSKGTGYGYDDGHRHGADELWDSAAAAAAQGAQDDAVGAIVGAVLDAFSGLSLQPGWRSLPSAAASTSAATLAAVPAAPRAADEVVASSAAIKFLEQALRHVSFSDMCARSAYYSALLHLAIAAAEAGPACATALGRGGSLGVATHLCAAHSQAALYLRFYSTQPPPASPSAASAGPQVGTRAASIAMPGAQQPPPAAPSVAAAAHPAAQASEADGDVELAKLIVAAASAVVIPGNAPLSAGALALAAPPEAEPGNEIGEESDRYIAALRGLQTDCAELGKDHAFASKSREAVPLRAQVKRVAKESSGLAAVLPISPSSSVFVRIDSACTSLWRTLITGPEDSPYEGACFVFDMFFPTEYPTVPPSVKLLTTGGGKVRFNPNLYNCGKVCLSLLGTWQGGKGEGWDAAASSAVQVLVSIQSLILVAQPYFNEPGYERTMGTPEGDKRCRSYNANIREQSIRYGMLEALRKPRPEFADVIRRHFMLRKDKIMATVQRWVLEAKEVSAAPSRRSSAPPDDDDDEEAGAPEDASPARSGNYAACMEDLAKQLEEELNKLNMVVV